MSLEKKIENVLNENFKVNHLEVINESYMHSGPDDAETHFKVIMVSEDFINLKLIERHRSVNERPILKWPSCAFITFIYNVRVV